MNVDKIKVYSSIKEELGVVMLFYKLHEELGFPKLVASASRGFDIQDIEYQEGNNIYRVTVEFEYVSSNYLVHGHQDKMQDDRYYIVVCWEDDCNIKKELNKNYNKDLFRVIELKDYAEIVPDEVRENAEEQNYYLINYNSTSADFRTFSDWKNSNIYRFSNNNNHVIKNNSKALIKQDKYIIGGFDIIRFSNIRLSDNSHEIELYKKLTDYPVSLFAMSEDDIRNDYVNNNIGHIFYNNFFELQDKNIRKTVKELLPDLKISHGSFQSITEDQYKKLIGK